MTKRNKIMLAVTSVIILLPMLIGIIFYNALPDKLATHFDFSGSANGYSSKTFAVFGLPAFMLLMHLLCLAVCMHDPKKKNISSKLFDVIMWICPVVSLIAALAVYSYALNWGVDSITILILAFGIIFTVIGNYFPKCKQNYTVGIKLPWTLDSEDNWNATHKFAGYVWTAGGILIILTAFLKIFWLFIGITALMAVIPTVYSYVYAGKNQSK